MIQGAVEIPAVILSIFILLKGGRRWPLTLTMVISGVACLLIVPLYFIDAEIQWLITSLSMLSKFAISSSNAIIPVYTAELYPTTIRNIGVGAANVPAGVALMLVPYLWNLVSIIETFIKFILFHALYELRNKILLLQNNHVYTKNIYNSTHLTKYNSNKYILPDNRKSIKGLFEHI